MIVKWEWECVYIYMYISVCESVLGRDLRGVCVGVGVVVVGVGGGWGVRTVQHMTCSLSGVPDFFDRNKMLSVYDLSHYQVPHCIKSFLLFCLICVYSSQFSILFWIMYLL